MSGASATFTVWASAWLHGAAAADDAIDALHEWAGLHDVVAGDEATADAVGLPQADEPSTLVDLLGALRRLGCDGARLVLPVPGDVRGLPAEGEFAKRALDRGEGVVLTGFDLGLVPEPIGDEVLRWMAYSLPWAPHAEPTTLPEAEHELRESVRATASTLATLNVASDRPGVRDEIDEMLRKRARSWPDGIPGRVLRVLQRADEVGAILTAAEDDAPGAALSATSAAARADALRPLGAAVRAARTAAVADAVRALTQRGIRP